MANSSEFKTSLLRMLKARIPFIAIHSFERKRVMEALALIGDEIHVPIYEHGLSRGIQDIKTNRVVNEDRSIAGGLDYVIQQISQRINLTFVFTEVSDIQDDNMVSRQFYDTVLQAMDRGGSICVITTNPVWSQLQRLGMNITLDTPDEDEMFEIVRDTVSEYINSNIIIEWREREFRLAAAILANLSKVEAENVLSTIMAKGNLSIDDLGELSKEKDNLISNISGLEKVKIESNTLGVAGLDGLRAWLEEQRLAMNSDFRERNLRSPRGVLLVGVPGCGKSLSAKFIAASWNLPLYRLDLAAIQGQYLGQSEGRLKDAFTSADHASPCVLWIDEIEKGLSGASSSSGDGGTSTRMVGQFLFWLQESKYKVFVVATANDVSKLPAELLRQGRFNQIFFVDLPREDERKSIIQLYLNKYFIPAITDDFLEILVRFSEGFSGADIESVMHEIGMKAAMYGDSIVTNEMFLQKFKDLVPMSKTNPEQIESIRNWGRERATMASGIPFGQNHDEKASKRSIII